MLIRKKAIEKILDSIGNNPVIAANGFISRDLYGVKNRESNFYMIGSMGLASSISLGVALENPKKRVFVFDGDGNILMNLGSLTTIGVCSPSNLVHIVFDNSKHESTGGQPTNSLKIELEKIALVANYKSFKVTNMKELENTLKKIQTIKKPVFILIKIKKSDKVSTRVELTPIEIKERFMKYLSK